MMENSELAEKGYWEGRWARVRLPAEVVREASSFLTMELIDIFDAYLPKKEGISIMEIGGAPGQFLAFFAKDFRYAPYAIDYSEIGCTKLRENFDLLKIKAAVYNRDLFTGDLSDLPRFDIVYSLGFIEHYQDLDLVVSKHLELLKEDGILMIGVPNYSGISGPVLRRLAPEMMSKHNPAAMDQNAWGTFEKKFRLRTIFKGYVGGFEPRYFKRCENRTIANQMLRLFFKLLRFAITDRARFLRRYNSKMWSAYLLGIYKKS
ncbi:MAG: class I SAM-dependent methyltransferase [Nitrospiraceae bacterium]|nr:MAG: class I SAM-dependent methyltransferase [Nitrospiraceae bacterium]